TGQDHGKQVKLSKSTTQFDSIATQLIRTLFDRYRNDWKENRKVPSVLIKSISEQHYSDSSTTFARIFHHSVLNGLVSYKM
uniref:Uncharacterized protein n=1 Tax=Ciona intestinalis TaxID=7719 RepID=H2XW18_CIOIN